jgi:DNA-binding SARP family transcriptional activator
MSTTTRRAVLAGAPAVAAGALAAGTAASAFAVAMTRATEVDLIFAVIERHRAASEIREAAHEHFLAMDALYPREADPEEFEEWSVEQRRAWRQEEIARCKKNPRNVAYDRWNEDCNAVDKITAELVATTPTTIAGIAALLGYWSEIMEEDTIDRAFEDTQEFLERLGGVLADVVPAA